MALEDTEAIRDQIIANVHGIDVTRVSTPTLATVGARVVESMSDVAMGLWSLRDFTFRYLEVNPFAVAAGENDVDLPDEWVNEGKQGGIWRLDGTLGRVRWRPLHIVTASLRTRPDETGDPAIYSISGLRKLRMFPAPAADTNLAILMLRSMPALIAEPDTDEVDGALTFSEQARLAIYRGAAAEESRRKGNIAEYGLWTRRFDAAVFDLCCNEQQGQPEPGFLPRYAGGADVFPDVED